MSQFQLIDFTEERTRRLKNMQLKLPHARRLHYFYFPESDFWFAVKELTTGIKAEYSDLSASIKIRRDEDGITEEREFPAGTRQWERTRLLIAEWSLVDDGERAVPVCEEAWQQLDAEWSDWMDTKIFDVNPELTGSPARKNRQEALENEVSDPRIPAPEPKEAKPAKT